MQVCCPAGSTDDDGGDYHDNNKDHDDNEYAEDDGTGKQRIRRTLSSASCKVLLHVSVLVVLIKVTALKFSPLSLG